jgi:hypothetical protein
MFSLRQFVLASMLLMNENNGGWGWSGVDVGRCDGRQGIIGSSSRQIIIIGVRTLEVDSEGFLLTFDSRMGRRRQLATGQSIDGQQMPDALTNEECEKVLVMPLVCLYTFGLIPYHTSHVRAYHLWPKVYLRMRCVIPRHMGVHNDVGYRLNIWFNLAVII